MIKTLDIAIKTVEGYKQEKVKARKKIKNP